MTMPTKTFKTPDAFMRHYQRQHKDAEWASDIASYRKWKVWADKGFEVAQKRVAELQAKWPGKSLD